MSPDVVIIGGGLSGLSAAAHLAGSGKNVTVLEQKDRLGGRCASYNLPGLDFPVDNCQHILTGACRNALAFFGKWTKTEELFEPLSAFKILGDDSYFDVSLKNYPAPFHLSKLFFNIFGFSRSACTAAVRLLALKWADKTKYPTAGSWLKINQPADINRLFWYPMLKSALNEHPSRIALAGFKKWVYGGLLNNRHSSRIYIPRLPLGTIFEQLEEKLKINGVKFRKKTLVTRIVPETGKVFCRNGQEYQADNLIAALPPSGLNNLLSASTAAKQPFSNLAGWNYSAISTLHLKLSECGGLPRMVFLPACYFEWFFTPVYSKDNNYVQLIKSASPGLKDKKELVEIGREIVSAVCRSDLAVEAASVFTDHRATISYNPEFVKTSFGPRTGLDNFFVAGDWAATGWPPTMESAVRSGILAARAVCPEIREPLPDLKPEALMKIFSCG
ncbi:MAG: FAD-dependent oxidoreductase [bacterium]